MFYIAANSDCIHQSFIPLGIFNLALHFLNLKSIVSDGKLDGYSLAIMIHQVLLTNPLQLLHILKFDRKHTHKWFYLANFVMTAVEFFALLFAQPWIERNKEICPDLLGALETTQAKRISFTYLPFALNALLTMSDIALWKVQEVVNKDCTEGQAYVCIRPDWLVWKIKYGWTKRRILYALMAIFLWGYSVYTMEYRVIGDFHGYMQLFSDINTAENDWTYGQWIPFLCSIMAVVNPTRNWLIETGRPSVLRMHGKSPPPRRLINDANFRKRLRKQTLRVRVGSKDMHFLGQNFLDDGRSGTAKSRELFEEE